MTSPVATTKVARATRASYTHPEVPETFGHDAIIGDAPGTTRLLGSWTAVHADLLATIAAEEQLDSRFTEYRSPTEDAPVGIHLRLSDGAFMRRLGAPALAFSSHGWAQLVSLLAAPDAPRSQAQNIAWCWPVLRSGVFSELVARSNRMEVEPIYLRTAVRAVNGRSVRYIRAVLTGRHSGRHFDDQAVAEALAARALPGVSGWWSRAANGSAGGVDLRNEGRSGAHAHIYASNSETGGKSISFSAAVRITALDAVIVSPGKTVGVDVQIASDSIAKRRNHTLSSKGLTDSRRREIAQDRMRMDIDATAGRAEALLAAWDAALDSYAPGLDRAGAELLATTRRAEAVSILIDWLLENGKVSPAEGEVLAKIMIEQTGLDQFRWGSRAYVAAAFAVLARRADSIETGTELAKQAGAWVTGAWKK
jgi:hypothetical protein